MLSSSQGAASRSRRRSDRIGSVLSLPLLLTLALTSCTPRAQASHEPFSETRFAQLRQEDALILIDVAASWCGTCAIQSEILAEYQERNPHVPLHILQVDFDGQKQAVATFRAPSQSTLILFQGQREIWRSVAEMRRDVLFTALDRGDAAARGGSPPAWESRSRWPERC